MSAETVAPAFAPPRESISWRSSDLLRIALLVALYFVTAKLGLLADAVSGFATTVWPPAGISLAALSLFGIRLWPGVALGAFLVNFTAGAPWLAACGMAAGNTLEAVVGTQLLRRFGRFDGSLDRLPAVVGFVILGAGLSTTISATMGVASGYLGGVIPAAAAGKAWLTWWLGDAMGVLILAPLFFSLAEKPRILLTPERQVEAGLLLACLTAASFLVFSPWFRPAQPSLLQPYLVFPFLIWAALRFLQHGTAVATLLVTGIAIVRTAAGYGPFARGTVNESLLALQAFMGTVAVTMLFLAAGMCERRRSDVRARLNYSVARVLADAPALEAMIAGMLRAICEALEWDCGNFWRVDSRTATLRHAAQWYRPDSGLEAFVEGSGMTFSPGVGMAGRVWKEARPIWVPSIARERNFQRGPLARKLGLNSAIGFPILLGQEVHGVLTFLSRAHREPDETLLQTMAATGSQIGQFIQRRRAEEELREAHAELEARIARRTEQLSDMNRALQGEIGERKEAEQSLRKLSTRLLRIQDEERQRLARELHDSTAQSLAALSMNLAVAKSCRTLDERARAALEESEALAQRCLREIRSLSYLLHPPLLEEIGLSAALRWCVQGFARRSGIAVDLELPPDFGRLPTEVEYALFRIVQECLTNIQRHSGSSSARVQLVRQPKRIALEVRDQGKGIPPGILDRHDGVELLGVGLLGMRERVRQLGGQIRIDSGSGGSAVQVEFAIQQEAS
ncbi:MAG TPA: MASE1 domain-containing protein [Candidatus Polarisedimenticolia bacterium]|jgi:signal transduction histidine kinase|nr:MASE1 domain-containing protein [Candidatus Polarisedimenticolia bacterium]